MITVEEVNAALDALGAPGRRENFSVIRVQFGLGGPNTYALNGFMYTQYYEAQMDARRVLLLLDAPHKFFLPGAKSLCFDDGAEGIYKISSDLTGRYNRTNVVLLLEEPYCRCLNKMTRNIRISAWVELDETAKK